MAQIKINDVFCLQYVLHADVAADGELVVVERTPAAVVDTLPQALKVKKFGT